MTLPDSTPQDEGVSDVPMILALAEEIRRVDGTHSLGAAALAEALLPHVKALMENSVSQERQHHDAKWPIRGRIWTRTSLGFPEKILDLSASINDTHATCRFAQSIRVADEDVLGLPEYVHVGPDAHACHQEYQESVAVRMAHREGLQHAIEVCHGQILRSEDGYERTTPTEDRDFNRGIRHAMETLASRLDPPQAMDENGDAEETIASA